MAISSENDEDEALWVRFGSIPLIVTLVLPLILGIFILLKCIVNHCCPTKRTTKEEMYGLEGRMTILPNVESSFVASPPHPSQPQPQQQQTQQQSMTPTASPTSPIPPTVNFQQIKQPKRQQKCVDSRHSLSSQPLKVKQDGMSNGTIPSSPTSVSSSSSATTTTVVLSTTPGDGYEAQICDSYETVDLSDSLKRSTLQRQLPDLPQLPNQLHNPPRRSSSVLSHDGTSELYATVGEVPQLHSVQSPETALSNYYNAASRKSAPIPSSSRGSKNLDGPSTSGSSSSHSKKNTNKNEPTPSSDSETYSGVNAVNHPYAKLKRNVVEHPYARVRTGSTGAGGDEETDTDNYDNPQPYAQTRTRNPPTRPLTALQSNNNVHSSANGNNGNMDGVSQPSLSSASSAANPVPPRRAGRQWRRSSHPQAQPNNDNQPNLSGDSQDRGYTSISVREPLSNIIANRSQVANTRNYDSHYATVSDDSEEMYAAIEDSDGNYMRIPGEDGNRHWLGETHLASPIPERREANSPLPPPPILPLSPEISPLDVTSQTPSNPNPPLYAQVTKKNKKGKAPLTPTMSAPTTHTIPSSSQTNNGASTDDTKVSTVNTGSLSPGNSGGQTQAQSSSAMNKNRHTVSENTATALLSPNDPSNSEPRRWSKADISYSEFEVVREPMFSGITRDFGHPSIIKSDRSSSSSAPHHHHLSISPPPPPLPQHKVASSSENKNLSLSGNAGDKHQKQEELLDEDNYNVIPEPGRLISRHGRDETDIKGHSSSSKNVHKISNSDNYQEIEDVDFHISNAYQEIERKEPSDYYQEIGASAVLNKDSEMTANLYQEIDKKKSQRDVEELLDEDEDPTDQFYESVKPISVSSNGPKFTTTPSPSHSQVSMSSLDRKHGYEKLRKKGPSTTNQPQGVGIHQPPNEIHINEFDDEDATTDDDEYATTNWSKKSNFGMESSKKKQRFAYDEHRRLAADSALDEDEDEDEDNLAMYERVKYPPYKYERLKESQDDLRDVDGERNDRNLYEDIGYSRVMKPKPKNVKKVLPLSSTSSVSAESSSSIMPSQNHNRGDNNVRPKNFTQVQDIEAKAFSPSYSSKGIHNQNMMLDGGVGTAGDMNLDQLYARVDKTKKKKHNINNSRIGVGDEDRITTTTAPTTSSAVNFSASSSSSSRIIEESQACILLRTDREEEDNSIEYI